MLKKVTDDYAGTSGGLDEQYLTSIKTGRSMQEIAAARGEGAEELVSGLTGSAEAQIVSPACARSLRSSGPGQVAGDPRVSRAAEGDAGRLCAVRLRLALRDEI
jgi:hypothetical protein